MRGDGVGVGLAVDEAAMVGIGIVVVVLGEELTDGGGATHEQRRRATSATPPSGFSSVGVF